MTGLWDGRSRAALRVGLALSAALDLIWLADALRRLRPGELSHPLAPHWLLALGANPIALVAIVALGLGALALFALGRAPIRAGAVALIALAICAESQAAILGGPHRSTFASGAVLLGWLCGLAWGRGLGRTPREDLAEAGATAMLAATYVGAAISKLAASGLAWADASTLRGVLLAQHRVSDHGLLARYMDAVVAHPGLATALAAATIVIQLGAFLYCVDPRLRIAWGTLLLGFHVNVALLTGIGYSGNIRLLLLFSYPWARLFRVRAEAAAPPSRDPAVERRVLYAACAIAVTVLALAWLLPVRDYTSLHNRPR